jgi:hypothetical protein
LREITLTSDNLLGKLNDFRGSHPKSQLKQLMCQYGFSPLSVPQGLDGIEVGGTASGVHAEYHADHGRDAEGKQHSGEGDDGFHFGKMFYCYRQRNAKHYAHQTAGD